MANWGWIYNIRSKFSWFGKFQVLTQKIGRLSEGKASGFGMPPFIREKFIKFW